MAKFVGTSLRGFDFSTPSDEAISARVHSDNTPRIRIDAGGRITWGPGDAAGDTNLYRDDADTLTTDDLFVATGGLVTITSNGAPNYNIPDGGLAIDTTNNVFYFRSNGAWNEVAGGGVAAVIIQSSPPAGQDEGTLWLDTDSLELSIYYDSQWVEVGGGGATIDVDGGNQILNDIFEGEVTNWPVVEFDGGVL